MFNKPKTFIHKIYHSIYSKFTSHPLISLFISSIFLIKIFLLCTHSPPAHIAISVSPLVNKKCENGMIFVYELPSMFNLDLITKCGHLDLDPWHWQCGVATKSGYGTIANELVGIIPTSLVQAWHRTNQFSSEIIFHDRIMRHECRTTEPESAAVYYIPFYAGLAVGKYLFSESTNEARDFHGVKLIEWVQRQPYWQKFNGSDHFLVLGRITWDFRRLTDPDQKWGSKFLNMPEIQNVTRLTIERAPSDYYDIGIPYPTGFHPRSVADIRAWQDFVRTYNRTSLFTFVGAAREDDGDDIRGLLLRTCQNESSSGRNGSKYASGTCRVVDCALTHCANGSVEITKSLLGSEFCLQPRGDSYTRRSVFDCMIAGSVPVLFWTRTMYDQYQLYLPNDPESYSVFIDHSDVSNGKKSIKEVLESYSTEEVRKMRERVIEIIPKIVYSDGEMEDAFQIAIDEVLRRVKEEKDLQLLE